MRNTLIIARKEIRTYFSSPIAYVILTAFLVFTGLLFIDSMSGAFREASLRGFFAGEVLGGILGETINGAFVLLLLAPVLTMRLLAEEAKLGTIELLLTAPVRDFEVVFGKYLAALFILGILLVMTLYYPLLLLIFAFAPWILLKAGHDATRAYRERSVLLRSDESPTATLRESELVDATKTE